MSFTIEIKRNADGVVRRCIQSGSWDENNEYLWSDGGNFDCDCNRGLFFSRVDEEPDADTSCGGECYSIRVTNEAGEELYCEDDFKGLS